MRTSFETEVLIQDYGDRSGWRTKTTIDLVQGEALDETLTFEQRRYQSEGFYKNEAVDRAEERTFESANETSRNRCSDDS